MNAQSLSTKKENDTSLFVSRVHAVVQSIPKGRVLTYGAVATKAGFPGASRAVGTLMKKNFDPAIPCHRVISSDGTVGQYNRGTERKIQLLTSEGVVIIKGRVRADAL